MNLPYYTVVFLTVIPTIFIAINVGLALNNRRGDTYSAVLRKVGERWLPVIMIVCFGFGLLAGHWWWANPVR